jgi:hypothetical protein
MNPSKEVPLFAKEVPLCERTNRPTHREEEPSVGQQRISGEIWLPNVVRATVKT